MRVAGRGREREGESGREGSGEREGDNPHCTELMRSNQAKQSAAAHHSLPHDITVSRKLAKNVYALYIVYTCTCTCTCTHMYIIIQCTKCNT